MTVKRDLLCSFVFDNSKLPVTAIRSSYFELSDVIPFHIYIVDTEALHWNKEVVQLSALPATYFPSDPAKYTKKGVQQ